MLAVVAAHKRTFQPSLQRPIQASKKGLTGEEAIRRLEEYGPNKLPEESRNAFLVYLSVSSTSRAAVTPAAAAAAAAGACIALCNVLHRRGTQALPLHCFAVLCVALLGTSSRMLRTEPVPPASVGTSSVYLPCLSSLQYMWNPLSWAMEAAAIIAIALLDYADFALIVALLLVNATISYVEEANADKAIKALTSGVSHSLTLGGEGG
jgi:magnesium-transporting ATPase (P-type)